MNKTKSNLYGSLQAPFQGFDSLEGYDVEIISQTLLRPANQQSQSVPNLSEVLDVIEDLRSAENL